VSIELLLYQPESQPCDSKTPNPTIPILKCQSQSESRSPVYPFPTMLLPHSCVAAAWLASNRLSLVASAAFLHFNSRNFCSTFFFACYNPRIACSSFCIACVSFYIASCMARMSPVP